MDYLFFFSLKKKKYFKNFIIYPKIPLKKNTNIFIKENLVISNFRILLI